MNNYNQSPPSRKRRKLVIGLVAFGITMISLAGSAFAEMTPPKGGGGTTPVTAHFKPPATFLGPIYYGGVQPVCAQGVGVHLERTAGGWRCEP
jgi:hypothetical protein